MPSFNHSAIFSSQGANNNQIICNPLNLKFTKLHQKNDDIFHRSGIWLLCYEDELVFIGYTLNNTDVRTQWNKYIQTVSFRGCHVGFSDSNLNHAMTLGLLGGLAPFQMEALKLKGSKISRLMIDYTNDKTSFRDPTVQFNTWPITFHLFTSNNPNISKNSLAIIRKVLELKLDPRAQVIGGLGKCKDAVKYIKVNHSKDFSY